MAKNADGTLTIYTQVDTTGVTKGLSSITKSINNITSSLSFTFGVVGFLALGKSAIDAASDLQEYRNVAEVTFGSLIGKLDEFNKVALESYGMSELMATQAASGFMAMGRAAGLGRDEASDMAVELTKMVGDFASFYNLSHERARTALAAVYTGETETLKQYGTMLQEVNLQQYENEYGLGRSVKTMSAAEKAQLRYNYILHVNKDVIGDFTRTQENWANQTRVLGERFKQLLITIGNGLVTILTPFVKMMNNLIQATITFANTLGDALTMIFGIKWQDLSSQYQGVSDSADGAADSQDELADSVTKAGKAAKNALQPWDKLNVIQTESAKGVDTNVNMDTSGVEDGASAMEQVTQSIWSSIDTLFKLGAYLGETLQGILDSIDWMAVYKKAAAFGTGLADFLNGLISPELFSTLASTIAHSLNTAIQAALSFGTKFDFTELGISLANAVNTFFRTFDFKQLADTFNTWVTKIRDGLKAFVQTVDWDSVLDGVGELISHLEIDNVIVTVLAFTFPGLVKALSHALYMSIAGQTIKLGLSKIVVTLAKGGLLNTTDVVGKLLDMFALVAGGAGTMGEAFEAMFPFVSKVVNGIISAVTKFMSSFGGVLAVIGGAVMTISNFITMLVDGFSWLNEILMVIGTAIAAVGAVVLGIATGPVAAAVAAIVSAVLTAIVVIKDNWTEICKFFGTVVTAIGQFFVNLWNGIVVLFTPVFTWFNDNVINPLVMLFTGLTTRIAQFFEGCWLIVQAVWITVSQWFVSYVINPLVQFFTNCCTNISNFFSNLWRSVQSIWTVASSWFNSTVIVPLINAFRPIASSISSVFSTALTSIKNLWGALSSWFTNSVINPLVNGFSSAVSSISRLFSTLWNSIVRGIATAMNGVVGAIESAINSLVFAVNNIISGFNKVAEWAADVVGVDYGGIDLMKKVSLNRISVPALATGAVIPPNKEFLAILGDQKHGTNIEAPLDTIKQALAEVLAMSGRVGDSGDIVINIDGEEVFRVVRNKDREYANQNGISAFSY
jgi:hypothetical protein